MPHALPHAGQWLLVLAAVRRALVPAADLLRSCPNRRLALSGSQELGQQCCPKPNMANSGPKYKGLPAYRSPERNKRRPERLSRFLPLGRAFLRCPAAVSGPWDARERNIALACQEKIFAIFCVKYGLRRTRIGHPIAISLELRGGARLRSVIRQSVAHHDHRGDMGDAA